MVDTSYFHHLLTYAQLLWPYALSLTSPFIHPSSKPSIPTHFLQLCLPHGLHLPSSPISTVLPLFLCDFSAEWLFVNTLQLQLFSSFLTVSSSYSFPPPTEKDKLKNFLARFTQFLCWLFCLGKKVLPGLLTVLGSLLIWFSTATAMCDPVCEGWKCYSIFPFLSQAQLL